jgi:uncharacterized membrane protein
MDKKQKIIQVYAVVICVVTVITVIICTASLVSALIDAKDPLHAGHYELQLTSFENFKMDALKSTQKDQAYIPDDETMHKMYDSAKADKIMSVQHYTNRSIVVNSLIIGISIILFASHWWLMRRVGNVELKKVNSG